ncbi:DoxX family protein [Salinirubellus salinus]|uniref:DoxX family protein n=1 Tax=Salinirubellus salinus TaxID=1364945 RepID=A0A9E7R3Y4_9EURY|nr:DoxX family protein [Salinirubellus salinus]UWM55386.1 DoxX family protein [Salinirubellus salinus]
MEQRLRRVTRPAVARVPDAATIARVGLGAMVLVAGVHKLLDPAAWALYVVPWLEPFILLSPVDFMLLNGWLELAFGLALLVDRYTAFASLVAAASLTATIGYLTVVWVTTGQFGDVLSPRRRPRDARVGGVRGGGAAVEGAVWSADRPGPSGARAAFFGSKVLRERSAKPTRAEQFGLRGSCRASCSAAVSPRPRRT